MSYSLAFTQAIIAVIYIADKLGQGVVEFIATQQIADDLNIPPSTLSLIMRRLNGAGIITTREGAKGGVALAVPPESITIHDIFKAVESGKPLFQRGMRLNATGDKPTRAQNAIQDVLNTAEHAMEATLMQTTIAGLLREINA